MTRFRKSFPGAAHGTRFSYVILSQSARSVEWRRSDGLEGTAALTEWHRLWHEEKSPAVTVPKATTQAKRVAVVNPEKTKARIDWAPGALERAAAEAISPFVDAKKAREARLARRRVQDAARRARKKAAK